MPACVCAACVLVPVQELATGTRVTAAIPPRQGGAGRTDGSRRQSGRSEEAATEVELGGQPGRGGNQRKGRYSLAGVAGSPVSPPAPCPDGTGEPIAVPAGRCHICVVCSNSWQFRPWILSLLSAHTQHLDALCADCLTFTAAPPHRSSQPGVQSVQAPSVLRSHSSMHQPNVFTPSLKPPPVPMPCNDGW